LTSEVNSIFGFIFFSFFFLPGQKTGFVVVVVSADVGQLNSMAEGIPWRGRDEKGEGNVMQIKKDAPLACCAHSERDGATNKQLFAAQAIAIKESAKVATNKKYRSRNRNRVTTDLETRKIGHST